MGPKTSKLIGRVGLRQTAARTASRFHLFFLILAGLYAVALLVSRFLAVIPGRYFDLREVWGLLPFAGVAALSLILAILLTRQPSASESARLIDTRMRTHDVFLTVARIAGAYGDFKPLVLNQAETRATEIDPKSVIRFRWLGRTCNVFLASTVMVAAVTLLPQYDLLGRNEERQREAERKRLLEETRKSSAERAAALKKSDPTSRQSKEVEEAITDLKQAFNQAKPKEVDANLKRLSEDQKDLGQMWRALSEKKLKDALERNPGGQQFGMRSLQKEAEWKEQMAKGDASGIQKELKELENMARKLSELTKASDKAALEAEMKQRMQELSDFVEREMNSRPCASALARAMDQLGLAGAKGLSQEALQALQESLNLSGLELEQLAQNARDLKSLEEALKALQLAKRLNKMEALDGSQTGKCEGMSDYAKLYKEMMAARKGEGEGEGEGEGDDGEGNGGIGGKGHGRGGRASENPDAESDFTSEQSKSAMTAGKILLEWKTKGIAEPGKAAVDYGKQLDSVKKGVSEAILREQIPPGYHDAIRQYFDSMEEKVAEPDKK